MTPPKRKRPRLGDIIEVPIPDKGYAYVHYVRHDHEHGHGAFLRVLPGIFKDRPKDIAKVAEQTELYLIFFPLGAAVHRGYVTIVGESPIPKRFDEWPLLRQCNENFETGVKTWFLSRGGGPAFKIGPLPEEYRDLSFREIPNLTELENRIASGWLPRDVT